MSQTIIQEIINDIIAIDPELKNIKSELEKLIQELIANKPQTPFTQEFKDSLKAQIIGAINEQRIAHEEDKKRDRNGMFHSLKFWMIGVSTVTAGLLMFTLFQYFEKFQQPSTQITYTQSNPDLVTLESASDYKELEQEKPVSKMRVIPEETSTIEQGGGASDNSNNVMMLAVPETASQPKIQSFSTNEEPVAEYSMMETATIEDTDLARDEIAKTFCETSNQFLLANNITENTTKTFIYDNQIYKATINFTSNSINIDHIGTQDDSKIQTELPNLNLFFEKNNFNIKSDYLLPIIEESDSYIEYYYPKNNNQEGITARIDKTTNIIFSIQNICIYQ